MESWRGVPILNNVVRLGLTKKVTLRRLERGEISTDVKREDILTGGVASAKALQH